MLALLKALNPKIWLIVASVVGASIFIGYVFHLGSTHNEMTHEKANRDAVSGADQGELGYKSCIPGELWDFGKERCVKLGSNRRY